MGASADFDVAKIFAHVARDIAHHEDLVSTRQHIVSLAHSLRLKVVAEGVESAEQLEFLRTLGCDQYQGYHYSAALPPGEFAELARTKQRVEPELSEFDPGRTYSKLSAYRPG